MKEEKKVPFDVNNAWDIAFKPHPETTPPIHSDPAGEGLGDEAIKETIGLFGKVDWSKAFENHISSTPQTGRIYTEGEVEAIKKASYKDGWDEALDWKDKMDNFVI